MESVGIDHEEFSPDWLRSFNKWSHCSDTEAINIIATLRALAIWLYEGMNMQPTGAGKVSLQ